MLGYCSSSTWCDRPDLPGLCWVAAAAVRPFGEPFVSGTLLKSNLLIKPQVWRLAREEKSVSWSPQ